jgi:hypothetical protein
MEETMLDWTNTELMHLTRDELCNLADRISARLPQLEPGSPDRLSALASPGQHPQGDASTGPSSVSRTHVGKPRPIPISRSVLVRRHTPCDAFLPGVREINGDRRIPG